MKPAYDATDAAKSPMMSSSDNKVQKSPNTYTGYCPIEGK